MSVVEAVYGGGAVAVAVAAAGDAGVVTASGASGFFPMFFAFG
ncbi:hypothetical protein [Halocatena pleomorpha]|nr:hypothetical protein [Halocatena pleomorpha]